MNGKRRGLRKLDNSMSINVKVVCPIRCSAAHRFLLESVRKKSTDLTHFAIPVTYSDHCILWRGLIPLFFQYNHHSLKAISIFMHTFDSIPCNPSWVWNTPELCLLMEHPMSMSTGCLTKICSLHKSLLADLSDSSINLTILLIPRSSHIDARPEKLFLTWENRLIRLQSVNAYIATLGGGYFLCRFLSQAVTLARWQRQVALSLDDSSLAAKCTVNEAYNFIHAGKISIAKIMLRKTKRQARKRNDVIVVSMCDSALWFATQVTLAHSSQHIYTRVNQHQLDTTLSMDPQISAPECTGWAALPTTVSKTVDDFLRIRIVQS